MTEPHQSEPLLPRREKVCLFVDYCDLHRALQELHDGVRLDYKRLKDWAARQREMLHAKYYTGEVHNEGGGGRQDFYSVLKRAGYDVLVSKNPYSPVQQSALDDKVRSACQCAMVWEMCSMTLSGRYDTFILITGAGALAQVVEWVRGRGVDVEVAFFSELCDQNLRSKATRFSEIAIRSVMFNKGRSGSEPEKRTKALA